MSSDAFKQANRKGKEGEHYVRDLMRSWGAKVTEVPDTYFPGYDLTCNGVKVEVKNDLKTHQTGNICLEVEALDHSEADILAYVTEFPRTVYFAPLPVVREFAHQWEPKRKGGEFGAELALVPRSIFIDRIHPQIISERP
jgi:hypothetical protein